MLEGVLTNFFSDGAANHQESEIPDIAPEPPQESL